MNTERLLALADFVENEREAKIDGETAPYWFDMTEWFDVEIQWTGTREGICGTVACLGGTACMLWVPGYADAHGKGNSSAQAADALGLSESQAHELFLGQSIGLHDISRKAAAHCLRNMVVNGGKVDWPTAVAIHPKEQES